MVFHLQILHADLTVGLDRSGNKGVTSDDRVFSDDGVAAEDGSSRIDRDIVADRRMTFLSGKLLPAASDSSVKSQMVIIQVM